MNTLGEVLLKAAAFRNPRLLRMSRDGKEQTLSNDQFLQAVHRVALALIRRGVSKGDLVAILSENRPEWMVADLGITLAGGVTVPLYMNLLAPQVAQILKDARPRLLFASTPEQAGKVREAFGPDGHDAPEIILLDPPPGAVVEHSWERFLASGAPTAADPSAEDLAARQSPGDLASVLYTSGTTGEPKGVCLTHRNLTGAIPVMPLLGALPGRDVVLSFLPLAHIFGRTVDIGFLSQGGSICYAPSLDHLGEDLKRHHPTVFAAVPRIFEKAYAAVQERIQSSPPWRRKLARACLAAAARRLASKASLLDGLMILLGDRLIFRRVRLGLGGRLRIAISGGAPLAPDILGFFLSIGVPIYEGYGLTEAAVLTVNLPGRLRLGSVGPAIPGVTLSIAPDGEVLAKGQVVMKGFRRSELDREAIDDQGWFHTGDLGRLDDDGFLFITGRKKELMKTSGGKYIAPSALEQRLMTLPFTAQALAVADGRAYPAALLVPNPVVLRKALMDLGLGEAPAAVLCADPRVLAWVEAQIEKAMEDLPRYERVKRVALIPEPFTVEAGELTPTLKMKRAVILKKYAAQVEGIYARD